MALQVAQGTFTGNGGTQTISITAGITPRVIAIGANASSIVQLWIDSMPAGNSGPIDGGAFSTTAITSVASGSFSVGADTAVNASGVAMYYIVLGDNGGKSQLATGSYTGNSTSQTITSSFLPAFINIFSTTVDAPVYRTDKMATDSAFQLHAGLSATGRITGMSSTGFTVGSSANTNGTGTTYYWFAVAASSITKTITYTGNGTSQAVSGVGFAPDFIFGKDNTTSNTATAAWRSASGGRDVSAHPIDATMYTAFGSDGFTVGSSVDTNTSGDTYNAVAFVSGVAVTSHYLTLLGVGA